MRAYILVTALAAMVLAAGCGDDGETPTVCGDGVIGGVEKCDDGSANGTPGDPCDTSCNLVCSAANEGGSCGTGMVCRSSKCVAVMCGDGTVDTGEDCDNGTKNGTAGDACNSDCHFNCKVDTDCGDNNACNGAEVCTNHVCGAGAPPAEGSSCGTDKVCHSAACVAITCGDGRTEGAEECDLGADNNGAAGTGCRADCTFECGPTHPATECAGASVACQQFACSANHTCESVANPALEATTCDLNTPPSVCISGNCTAPPVCQKFVCEGQSCTAEADATLNNLDCDATDPSKYCSNGACIQAVCGNGVLDRGEVCDHGNDNGTTGDSCARNCQFTCLVDNDCNDGNVCNGAETCTNNACTPGTPLSDGSSCPSATNPNDFCRAGACVSPVCGNQAREPGEQCDDGNALNLDGCDSVCKFEPAARIISLQQQFATSTFCPANALGAAIAADAQPIIQATWDVPVKDGTQSIVFKFLDLTDLTGQNATFKLGFINASAGGRTLVDVPVCGNRVCEEGKGPGTSETIENCPGDCTYDGNSDLDWWYIRDRSSVDANENPLVQLPGQVTAGHLTAGPGTISLNLLFAFEPAQVTLFNTKVDATLDPGLSKPLVSTTGAPPGHLASENLSPTLTTFSTSSSGAMCSAVSLESLFNAPMPALLQSVCTLPDGATAAFTSENRLLDAFVAGCLVFGSPGIVPTQPDGSTDGAIYKFTADPVSFKITSCTKDGQAAVLADCLRAATYSSYFQFVSDRVIIKRN